MIVLAIRQRNGCHIPFAKTIMTFVPKNNYNDGYDSRLSCIMYEHKKGPNMSEHYRALRDCHTVIIVLALLNYKKNLNCAMLI